MVGPLRKQEREAVEASTSEKLRHFSEYVILSKERRVVLTFYCSGLLRIRVTQI